jgi:ABC-2 type transport system permease protein
MNTMKWLVKREFWENKGGFFWAPVIVGGFWTLLVAVTILVLTVLGNGHGFDINGETVHTLSRALTPDEQQHAIQALARGYMGFSVPVFAVLTITMFFFCIGCLYDDRRDRSVLFWKSMPISDSDTVLSKLVMAIVVAPLIALVVATIASLVMVFTILAASAFMGVNAFGSILMHSSLYLSPFEIAGSFPIYAMWALPTIGWLMLVSAWARSFPFLWAVGTPLFAGFLLTFFNAIFRFGWNVEWFWANIVGRILGGTVPYIWFAYHPASTVGESVVRSADGVSVHSHGSDMGIIMMQSWRVLGTSDLWIGVALGAAMIFAAIRLRRWRDEG